MALSRKRWYRELRGIETDPCRVGLMEEVNELETSFFTLGPFTKLVFFVAEVLCSIGFPIVHRTVITLRQLRNYAEDLELNNAYLKARIAELENNATQQKTCSRRLRLFRSSSRLVKAACLPQGAKQ